MDYFYNRVEGQRKAISLISLSIVARYLDVIHIDISSDNIELQVRQIA
jgi:hypothetical protein